MRRHEVDALKELADNFKRHAESVRERGQKYVSEYKDMSGYDRCEGKAQAYTHCAEEVERFIRHLNAP